MINYNALSRNVLPLYISAGLVPDMSAAHVFGRAPSAVDTAVTDIWNYAGTQNVWLAPTAARIHAIVSSSASDAGSGVGARTVKIWGLTSWSSEESSETITLNGLTPVNTVHSYVIINKAKVMTSGDTSINVGNITGTAATDTTVSFQIGEGLGASQLAIYGVPSGKNFYLTRFFASMNDNSLTRTVDCNLLCNENPTSQIKNFINFRDFNIQSTGTTWQSAILSLPERFVGPCILKVQAKGSANGIDVCAGFEGVLTSA